MAMKLGKNVKAISPLIATIILIAITVAGGLLVYALFASTASVGSAKAQLQIENMDLVMPTQGDVAFAITIKNVGNKPTNQLIVKLGSTVINEGEEAQTLQPGQSVSFVKNDLPRAEYIVGNAYIVTVEASFSDGSSSSLVATVYCHS